MELDSTFVKISILYRMIQRTLSAAAQKLPVVTLTGPRQSGKTIRTDFFRGLDFYKKIATSEVSSYLIYGEEVSQARSEQTVLRWQDSADLLA